VGLGPDSPPSKLVSVLVAWDPTVTLDPVATNCKGAVEAEVETPCEVLGWSQKI
jgi:hypothetical protein